MQTAAITATVECMRFAVLGLLVYSAFATEDTASKEENVALPTSDNGVVQTVLPTAAPSSAFLSCDVWVEPDQNCRLSGDTVLHQLQVHVEA
jgi:hypothetical protein